MIRNNVTVAVLLSTYNGSKYISQQLQSLLEQNSNDFKVFIRDDGSSDNTIAICQAYCEEYPDKFTMLIDDKGNLGVTRSFSELLSNIHSEIYMFCDQDDIWLENKVKNAKDNYFKYTAKYGTQLPLLFFTDLLPFQDNGTILSDSFLKSIDVNPNPSFEDIIFSSPVWGCTTYFNNALKSIALPMPNYIRYHDYWLCILAFLNGKLIFINEKDIKYRLHSSNASVAVSTFNRLKLKTIFKRIKMFLIGDKKGRDIIQRKINQMILGIERSSKESKYKFYKSMNQGRLSKILYFLWTKSLRKRSILLSPNLLWAVLHYKKRED